MWIETESGDLLNLAPLTSCGVLPGTANNCAWQIMAWVEKQSFLISSHKTKEGAKTALHILYLKISEFQLHCLE